MHYLLKYRSEIDGLRALAVIPVILFHAGFNAFSGGFVGVDIFFVISGYLITSIISNQMENGCFALSDFYVRRARRIIPALVVMILACIPVAWACFMPKAMDNFSQSVLYTAIFASNIYYARSINYFSPDAEMNPLLHTWSLSVEEQFYILFPLFVFATLKFSKKKQVITFVIIAICSIVSAELLIVNKPNFSFYQLPTRAWELIIGAIIARTQYDLTSSVKQRFYSSILSATGLILIFLSVFVFGKSTPSPGVKMLVPTLGAGLIILYANKHNLVGRMLGSKPFVYIGLLSYSAYLWHQPLIAFTKSLCSEGRQDECVYVAIVATIVLSFISWRFVERPFRNANFIKANTIIVFTLSSLTTLALFGFVGKETNGYMARYSKIQQEVLSYQHYPNKKYYRDDFCLLMPEQNYKEFSSECFAQEKGNEILVWGDSHAAALYYGIQNEFENVTQLTTSVCPPIFEYGRSHYKNCPESNKFVFDYIERKQPKYIVMHAHWTSYINATLEMDLFRTISILKSISPRSRIVLVGPVPNYNPWLPELLIKDNVNLVEKPLIKNVNPTGFSNADAILKSASDFDGVYFVSLLDEFCSELGCRVFLGDSTQIALSTWDYGHLTADGSLFASKPIRDVLINNR